MKRQAADWKNTCKDTTDDLLPKIYKELSKQNRRKMKDGPTILINTLPEKICR